MSRPVLFIKCSNPFSKSSSLNTCFSVSSLQLPFLDFDNVPVFSHAFFLFSTSFFVNPCLSMSIHSVKNFFPSPMFTIHWEHRRLQRSQTQPFHIIKTPVNCIFIVIGSTGNAYVVSVSASSIACNCPDKVSACKHILFILSVCGLIPFGANQTSVSPARLLKLMHAKPSLPKLQLALLDKHTTKLCCTHAYPPCVFCAKHPNEHPDEHPCRTLIICSKCGFLSHKNCLSKFLMVDNNSASFNEICPRCGRSSHRLESLFVNGHRNFSHVLRHRGYATLVPTFNLHQPIPINHGLNNSVNRGNDEEPFLQLITTNPDTGTGSDNRPQLRDV